MKFKDISERGISREIIDTVQRKDGHHRFTSDDLKILSKDLSKKLGMIGLKFEHHLLQYRSKLNMKDTGVIGNYWDDIYVTLNPEMMGQSYNIEFSISAGGNQRVLHKIGKITILKDGKYKIKYFG